MALSDEKINNFRFDFISCGESDGEYNDYTVSNMILNLKDTLIYLKEKGFEKFILIGCSMGGRIISLIDEKEFNIDKLILWYPALDYGRGIFNIPSKKEKTADMAEGFDNSKLQSEFLEFITKFKNDSLPKILELLQQYKNEKNIIILKNYEEVDNFLKNLN